LLPPACRPAASQLLCIAPGGRARPREVYAYDLTPLPACPPQQGPPLALRNRRLFYRLSEGEGIPDGMKVDRDGRLFIGCGDGVHVCAPDGRRLGKFKVEGGGAQLCFGGEAGRTLLILSETRALTIELTTECGL
jgi:gluconolactonase